MTFSLPTTDQSRFDALLASIRFSGTFDSTDAITLTLIQLTLSTTVPICIADVQKAYGEPQGYHYEAIQKRLQAMHADKQYSGFAELLFGGRNCTAEMALLCDIIAVLAFQPGGINAFGLHFEAQPEEFGHE